MIGDRRAVGTALSLVSALCLAGCGAWAAPALSAGPALGASSGSVVDLRGCDFYGEPPSDPADVGPWLEQVRATTGKVVVAGWPNGEVKGYLRWDEYRDRRDYRPPPGEVEEMQAASDAHRREVEADPLVVYSCRTDEPAGRWVEGLGWVSDAEYGSPNYSPEAVVVARAGPNALERWPQVTRFQELADRRSKERLTPSEEAEYQALLAQARAEVATG